MPLRYRRQPPPNPQSQELCQRLVKEWQHPRDDAPEPVIIEEGGKAGRPTHLYVIWEEWSALNQQERSEIIMDAYEEVRGLDEAALVTVAMGLTADEAKRMNVHYE